jgi:RNA polymerase sigma-70 factor (ECF subfamily)
MSNRTTKPTPHPSPADDEKLLAEFIASGNIEIFGQLYTRYTALVYGLCLKYLGNQPDAEDAVVEIFEDLVSRIASYRVRNFRTWLWSVARNHCLQILRKKKQTIRVDFDDRVVESSHFLHLLSDGDDETALAALARCMEKLPERQKEAIEMFFVEKQSYADIADATLGEVKGVKSYIQNGKRNLRLCLERQGVRL